MNPPTAGDATFPWYEQAFQQDYLDLYLHRDLAEAARAVRFLTEALELNEGHRLLDLCCGPGRHLAFLKDRVGQAVGIDLSRPLLRRAQIHCREIQGAGGPHEEPNLVRADMRRLPLASGSFDRVVNLFTSFGYFAEATENQRVLDEIGRVLRPGGLLALDHINRRALLKGLEPESERTLASGLRVTEQRRWEAATERVVKHVTLEFADRTVKCWTESVRVYEPEELEGMMRRAGLTPRARYGDYAGENWAETAGRLIVIART
jgi:SAM-dependent methyltransferase